jgi:hypothetical protein
MRGGLRRAASGPAAPGCARHPHGQREKRLTAVGTPNQKLQHTGHAKE